MAAIEVYHNNSASEHQSRFTTLSNEGFRLISLSCYGDSDEALYAAVWEQKAGPSWRAVHGLNADQYQKKFNSLQEKGLHPTIITATGEGTDARFGGVFEKNGRKTLTRFGLKEKKNWGESDSVLFSHWNGKAQGNKLELIWLTSYGDEDEPKYAAIWQDQTPDGAYEYSLNENGKSFQKSFDFWTKKNANYLGIVHDPYTLTAVAVNTDGPRYSGVWQERNPWGQWRAYYGMSSSGFQNRFNDMKAAGFHPARVVGGGGTGDDIRFAAIFVN